MRILMKTRILLICSCIGLTGCSTVSSKRASIWVDMRSGEPVVYEALLRDLSGVDVVYLGEKHTLQRHHDVQQQMVEAMSRCGRPVVVGFEMIEKKDQPALDRYASSQLDFEGLAEAIQWSAQWSNYAQYKAIFETARQNRMVLIGLNAPRQIIRQIGRSGFESLDDSAREQLPEQMNFDDEMYRMHLRDVMQAMPSAMPERMNSMIQAQMTRDEMMAHTLVEYLQANAQRSVLALVICGSGHVNYGMGTARRVADRMPQLRSRIIVMSASGDIHAAGSVPQMRPFNESRTEMPVPIADYVYVTSPPRE